MVPLPALPRWQGQLLGAVKEARWEVQACLCQSFKGPRCPALTLCIHPAFVLFSHILLFDFASLPVLGTFCLIVLVLCVQKHAVPPLAALTPPSGSSKVPFSHRVRLAGMKISRPPTSVGHYKMVKHRGDKGNEENPHR